MQSDNWAKYICKDNTKSLSLKLIKIDAITDKLMLIFKMKNSFQVSLCKSWNTNTAKHLATLAQMTVLPWCGMDLTVPRFNLDEESVIF
jgi:hypothetical protein